MIKKFLIAAAMTVALTGTATAQMVPEGSGNNLFDRVGTLEAEVDAFEAEVDTLEAEVDTLEAAVGARLTALEDSIFGDGIPVVTVLTTQNKPVNADFTMVMPTTGDFAIVAPPNGFYKVSGGTAKRAVKLLAFRAGSTSPSSRAEIIRPAGVIKILILPDGWQFLEGAPNI